MRKRRRVLQQLQQNCQQLKSNGERQARLVVCTAWMRQRCSSEVRVDYGSACRGLSTLDSDTVSIIECTRPETHRREELSQLWGQDIFARKYMHEKLTKCPNFIRFLPEKILFARIWEGNYHPYPPSPAPMQKPNLSLWHSCFEPFCRFPTGQCVKLFCVLLC